MSRSGEDKRQAIMEAALDLFVELGFHGAPTSLIAKRAGVGVGTIYRYFQSKEELIHRIYDDLHGRFSQRFTAEFDSTAPLQERFVYLIGRILTFFIESPRGFIFLEKYHFSPFAVAEQQEIPEEEHNLVRRLVWEGRDAGVFKDTDVPVLLCIAIGPVISLAKEHIAGRLNIDDSTILITTQACWDALRK